MLRHLERDEEGSQCRAASTTAVQLGDKGDGSPASRADALRRFSVHNAGHVPDIIEGNTQYEFKGYSPYLPTPALGHGSQRCGGAPSTADGHFIAFGNTEEALVKRVLGLRQRGEAGQRPYDRTAGVGYVAAHRGDYADALSKRKTVVLFVVETSGAVCTRGVRLLGHLARQVRRKGATDGTVYGTHRFSTRSFFLHHLTNISAAVSLGDARIIGNAASFASFTHSTARVAAP